MPTQETIVTFKVFSLNLTFENGQPRLAESDLDLDHLVTQFGKWALGNPLLSKVYRLLYLSLGTGPYM